MHAIPLSNVRSKWSLMAEASAEEALLAVDLYNQTKLPRRLEAYFIHMHLAWLYLLHARFRRDGIDYRYRRSNGRFEKVDGEPKTWDLARCVIERWGDNDPVRKNLELTIALRNKIEHRFEDATTIATAGYAQALLLNYEDELTSAFGVNRSLGDRLRFPVFVGAFTTDGVERLVRTRRDLPRATGDLIASFTAGLDPAVAEDQRFEFRVHLVQKTGPKSTADLWMTFHRDDELTDEQRRVFENLGQHGRVVVRDRLRPVANLGLMKPAAASAAIEARIPFRFRASSEFPAAWRALDCRPPSSAPNPERTKDQYCVYDEPHRDYLYTQAFVEKVVRETGTDAKFKTFIGRKPALKPV
jgi:hypothetical protein